MKKVNHRRILYSDGTVKTDLWLLGSKRHRLDGPAVLHYDERGKIKRELWYKEGKLHREDGPAKTKYNKHHSISDEIWYKDGKVHRDNGPAIIKNIPRHSTEQRIWYQNDKIHRTDGPAIINHIFSCRATSYRIKPMYMIEEYWYKNDLRHRDDGPAYIKYRSDGKSISTIWYMGGYDVTQYMKQWLEINKLKFPRSWKRWSIDDKILFKLSFTSPY